MNNKTKVFSSRKFKKFFTLFFCLIMISCLSIKIVDNIVCTSSGFCTLAFGLAMPVGAKSYIQNDYGYEYENAEIFSVEYTDASEIERKPVVTSEEVTQVSGQNDRPTVDSDNSTRYSIIERQIAGSGTYSDGFWVKNTTQNTINISEELQKRPDANITLNGDVQVLIVHTHTSESYIDKDLGYYPADFYPRCTDQNYNIVAVGEAIKKQLDSAGINTLHDKTVHDNPSYNGAYTRAANTIENNLANHPTIQVVLDIHRDAIGNDESGRVKPTFTYNGKKAAQVMIISGCNDGGSWYFPDWEYNLRLALRIQQKGEQLYPGMMRPLNFSESEYNMSITHNSLLIEIGSDVNTFDEAVYSGELLGNVLKEVLLELTK